MFALNVQIALERVLFLLTTLCPSNLDVLEMASDGACFLFLQQALKLC